MELAQLRYFVAVVEEGGFTRAGARLHVSQPGVSAQVAQLERELGQRLLDRSGRRVTPTEAGRAVLSYARAALAAVEGVRRTAEEFSGLLRGRVALGLIPGAASAAVDGFDVVEVLGAFHDEHPGVEIALSEDTSERMLAALLRGELDLAVVGLAGEPPPGVSCQVVLDEPLVAAVRADDPLVAAAVDGEIPLAALRGRALISLPRGTGLRGVLERACAQAGFAPRVDFEAAAPAVLVRLAARGLGVAVVPSGAESGAGPRADVDAGPASGTATGAGTGTATGLGSSSTGTGTGTGTGLCALRITEPRLTGRVALAWRTDGPPGPAAHTLLGRLRAQAPGRPAP
ncbi:LysR family transcriptional regulator [Streptomyces virginiae]|uniref:LysR family transcriptional regulator n=1 Tax=Streptomyces virginiae TaxID=1961 RepID=UPI002DDBDB7E|nr:LysR substrate-binding domain-containing protein [Streptomyces virginiae]WSC80220.1 LysR substrate-binding domain-containing protein [Streptomyces virginiae]